MSLTPYHCIFKHAKSGESKPSVLSHDIPENDGIPTLQAFVFGEQFKYTDIEEEGRVTVLPPLFEDKNESSSLFYQAITRSDNSDYYVICFIGKGVDSNTLVRFKVEFEDYCKRDLSSCLMPLYENILVAKASDWFDNCILYLIRFLNAYKDKISYFIYKLLMGDVLKVQGEDKDAERFIRMFSKLSNTKNQFLKDLYEEYDVFDNDDSIYSEPENPQYFTVNEKTDLTVLDQFSMDFSNDLVHMIEANESYFLIHLTIENKITKLNEEEERVLSLLFDALMDNYALYKLYSLLKTMEGRELILQRIGRKITMYRGEVKSATLVLNEFWKEFDQN